MRVECDGSGKMNRLDFKKINGMVNVILEDKVFRLETSEGSLGVVIEHFINKELFNNIVETMYANSRILDLDQAIRDKNRGLALEYLAFLFALVGEDNIVYMLTLTINIVIMVTFNYFYMYKLDNLGFKNGCNEVDILIGLIINIAINLYPEHPLKGIISLINNLNIQDDIHEFVVKQCVDIYVEDISSNRPTIH